MARNPTAIERRRLLKGIGTVGIAGLAGCTGGGSDETETGGSGETDSGSGNGESGGSSGSSDGGNGSDPVSIVYHDRDEPAKRYATVFEETHSGIDVEATIEPPTERYKGLIAKISAGNAPEVLGLDVVRIAQFAELGALSELGSFIDSLEYADDIYQPLRDDFVTYDGTTWGAPFWIDMSVCYYNKNHMEAVGLDPGNPFDTWSEFKSALEALSSDGPAETAFGASFRSGLSEFFWYPFAWANGIDFLNDDQTKCLFDQQEAIDALQLFVDIYNDDAYSTTDLISAEWNEFHDPFVNEEMSVIFSSGFATGHTRRNNEEMYNNYLGNTMFPRPEGGTKQTFIGGNSIVIPKQTQQNPEKFEAAKEFVRWVNSEEGSRVTLENGYFPGTKSAFELDIAQQEPAKTLYEPFNEALSKGHAPPIHPSYEEVVAPIRTAISEALQRNQTPEEALTAAVSKIDKALQG